jgi:hypothetical protein
MTYVQFGTNRIKFYEAGPRGQCLKELKWKLYTKFIYFLKLYYGCHN